MSKQDGRRLTPGEVQQLAPYDLLSMVLRDAPNGAVQQAISRVYGEMMAADESDKYIKITLAEILLDGLRHGNWPS